MVAMVTEHEMVRDPKLYSNISISLSKIVKCFCFFHTFQNNPHFGQCRPYLKSLNGYYYIITTNSG